MPSSEEALKQTIHSYDRTAASYARRTYNSQMSQQREWFTELLPNPVARILDLGCGPGWDTLFYRSRAFNVTSVDLSIGMLEEARQRVPEGQFVQADMRKLPLKSFRFDGIWASASFLHLPKESAGLALAEMERVLVEGGILFMAVKRGEAESWREPEDAEVRFYYAYYLSDELAASVIRAGFEILSLSENFSKLQFHPDGSPVCWVNLFARKLTR